MYYYTQKLLQYIWDEMIKNKLYLSFKLMFYAVTEKYPLECVFVYKSISLLNESILKAFNKFTVF